MSEATWNLIIGGLIAIVSSTFTSWLTFVYAKKQKDKERQWQQEDLHKERRKEVREQRLNQIEEFVVKEHEWTNSVFTKFQKIDMPQEKFQQFASETDLERNQLDFGIVRGYAFPDIGNLLALLRACNNEISEFILEQRECFEHGIPIPNYLDDLDTKCNASLQQSIKIIAQIDDYKAYRLYDTYIAPKNYMHR